ncbi:hypothetical protein PR048_022098 [Dryococelus australis]|uniref:Uncharacterized protein n=1 Tax=Dryococelus australis TaxID=614101 RepID=A0ABQ9H0A5_9NEOP|nr:hypothetical protein PR048_022098 [Dryococelus australis]
MHLGHSSSKALYRCRRMVQCWTKADGSLFNCPENVSSVWNRIGVGRNCESVQLFTLGVADLVFQPSGSLRIFGSGNRAGRYRLSVGFLRDLPFPPPFHSGAAPFSPHITLIDSQDLAVKGHPNLSAQLSIYFRKKGGGEENFDSCIKLFPKIRLDHNLLASLTPIMNLAGEKTIIRVLRLPSGSLRIFGSGNRAGRYRLSVGFLRDLPFPPPFHSGAAPFSPHITLIDSQDLAVKGHPNLSAQLSIYFRKKGGGASSRKFLDLKFDKSLHVFVCFLNTSGPRWLNG